MSLYFDPDSDEAQDGPIFDLPAHLRARAQCMHAAAIVIDRFGMLLRGPTGSGKSLLQRHLRREARARGLYAGLVSDDYVQLAPTGTDIDSAQSLPSLVAFAPNSTSRLQEVRGLGILEVGPDHALDRAVMHLLVDLVEPRHMPRMPTREQTIDEWQGVPIKHLYVPQKAAVAASDLVFALLSTWKRGH